MAVQLFTPDPLTLAAGSVAEKVTDTGENDRAVTSLTIQSDLSNTATVAVGGPSVTITSGLQIGPGDSVMLTADKVGSSSEEFKLSDIYMVSGSSGQTLRFGAFRRP